MSILIFWNLVHLKITVLYCNQHTEFRNWQAYPQIGWINYLTVGWAIKDNQWSSIKVLLIRITLAFYLLASFSTLVVLNFEGSALPTRVSLTMLAVFVLVFLIFGTDKCRWPLFVIPLSLKHIHHIHLQIGPHRSRWLPRKLLLINARGYCNVYAHQEG